MVYKYSIFTETWSLALSLIQFLIDIPFFVYALMRSISENQWQKLTVKPKSLDNEIILVHTISAIQDFYYFNFIIYFADMCRLPEPHPD